MNTKEYAQHTKVSARTLDYLRHEMTEGVHYSRVGVRIRYHVTEADEFVSHAKRGQVAHASEVDDLKELAGPRPGELAGLQVRHVMKEGDVRYISIEQQFTGKRAKLGGGRIDSLKTKWSRRNVPLHRALHEPLDAWLKSGWKAWVGRSPEADDFLFPGSDGRPYRRHDADGFRDDLERAGCPIVFNDEPLTPYALRHLFSTLLQEVHAHDAAHDRLMGHRPKDTKNLNYSVKQLPFLVGEIQKIKFDLPADAPGFGAERASDEDPVVIEAEGTYVA